MNPKIPKIAEILIHLIAVAVIIVLAIRSYELITYIIVEATGEGTYSIGRNGNSPTETNNSQKIWHILVYSLYSAGWFVSYFLFFKRYHNALKKKLYALCFGWVGLSIIHTVVVIIAGVVLRSEVVDQPVATVFRISAFSSLTDSILGLYFIIVVIAFLAQTAIQFLYRYQELEQADHVQTELALIRSQLRPHFFFNTLNNLYSMAIENKDENLANGIQNLTGLMRYSLNYSTKELVSVHDEWEYIHTYVELQKLRVDPSLVDIAIQHSGNLQIAKIAPMILINFVENAFKHGISYERPSFISIRLVVDREQIQLLVKNSNNPSTQESGHSGIGTKQTKKLLTLYYKDDFSLDIQTENDIYQLRLCLPIR